MDAGKRVIVAMSGGVDSSVAAYLLKNNGYECIGATLRLFNEGSEEEECAAEAAAALGIEHRVIDLTAEFREKVVCPFVECYLAGLTPNPCIECNRFIKFGALARFARDLKADYIASGHYVRIASDPSSGRFFLSRAMDLTKDQSYVLSCLTQEELSRAIFPLGEITKAKVKEIAGRMHLPNLDKPESQDICFIPQGDFASFIEDYTGQCLRPGDILSAEGKVIGRHRGLARYTLGQRRGLGISSDKRLFVTAKSVEDNTLTLGPEDELYSLSLTMTDISWGALSGIREPVRCGIVTRYHQAETPCTVYDEGSGRLKARFDTPIRAVTPGQTAVLYGGDKVLAAGRIIGAGD